MSKFRNTQSLDDFKKSRGITKLDLYESKSGGEYFIYDIDEESGEITYGYVSSKLDSSKPMFISIVITDDDEEIPCLHNAGEQKLTRSL